MLLFDEIKIRNLYIIFIYCILISIKSIITEEFIDIKKLSSCDDYFVVLDTGLYLYDFNTNNCSILHQFNNSVYRINTNNNINLTELYYRYRAYIFCLVNEYLFIFNEYTNQLFNYKINEINDFINYYYNILPYKMENNITSFIIVSNVDTMCLNFDFYKFNINEDINKINTIPVDNINVQNKTIKCEINSLLSSINCLYYSISILSENVGFIRKNFIINYRYIIVEQTEIKSYEINCGDVKQIKMENLNNDKTFVFLLSNNFTKHCFINDVISNAFIDIESQDSCQYQLENILSEKIKNYSIIIDNINNCQLSDYQKCKCIDLITLQKIKFIKYEEIVKKILYDSRNNQELIQKLNRFIEDGININYLDIYKDLRISKDNITVELTTALLQELNENNSNLSSINLGICKDILKYNYDISDESNLYILKIEKEQKYKYYPLIEYEVFYPINEEKMEILDLNLCNDTDIEISIPIIINNNSIDKHNPKSDFYTDICYKVTSDDKTDILITDRRDEFVVKNLSLCEDICELISYDFINNKAKCSCDVKTEINLDEEHKRITKKKLFKDFFDFQKITNIGIVKCYKTVFKINELIKNYGSFIIIFIFILYLICINIFYCKSWKNLNDEIIKIILAKNKKEIGIKNRKINIFHFKDKKNKGINSRKIILENPSSFKRIKNIKKLQKKNEIRKEKYKSISDYIDSEIDSLSYKEALKLDKRTYIQFYFSLLKKKNSIIFSFYPNKDYNSQIIKIFLFFFFYASDITINALFFNDDAMHKIYTDSGAFNFLYQLPKTIYSFLISNVINLIIGYLSLTEDTFIFIKEQTYNISKMSKKRINCMQMKFCFFFFVTPILLFIFWFYISCFCCIYENTQMHLIKDSLMSLGLSFIYPFFISLIPGIFRIPSLNNNKGNRIYMYKFSQFIENLF